MSYNLAIWEGDLPENHEAAAEVFETLMDRWQEGDLSPPSSRIAAYVDALLQRWPDITTDRGEESPWSDGPLINNASGPILYFGMIWSMAEEAATYAAELADAHGLVCYDPEAGVLRR